MKSKTKLFFLKLFILIPICFFSGNGKDDTLKKKETPTHYFQNLVFSNGYISGERELQKVSQWNNHNLQNKLKTFKYSQINSGFLIPLLTKELNSSDSVSRPNWHFFITGNFLNAYIEFTGIKRQLNFSRYSIGTRSLYNNGKKDVFFFDFSPFLSYELQQIEKPQLRFSSTFIWSHVFSEKFSLRAGYTRSFIFGDRILLPLIGFRIGRLDRTYLSFQFPRNVTLSVPLKRSISLNVVAKPIGNVFDFKDRDSLYSGVNNKLIFGWRDVCLGSGFDFHPNKFFSFFAHFGIATEKSSLAFYSRASNEGNKFKSYKWFYNENLPRTPYINLGLSVKFGATKISSGNFNLYELMNLNSENDPGNTNSGSNSNEIPPASKGKNSLLRINEISDIINDVDLYD